MGTLKIGQNGLLAALPAAVYRRLESELEPVALLTGRVLHDCNSPLGRIYFPINCTISLCCELEDGVSEEIARVGNEGLVGVAPFLHEQTLLNHPVVQNPGVAYRIKTEVLMREFEGGGPLQAVLLRYVQALITQIGQTGAWTHHHKVEQQLCRKLLFCLDRLPANDVSITPEQIGAMLGVRESVSDFARNRSQDSM